MSRMQRNTQREKRKREGKSGRKNDSQKLALRWFDVCTDN